MAPRDRPDERPADIVWIMADQHRADFLGCAGHRAVRTPNLDRLAGEGVRFDRTSCQGPLCMPARASLLTERYVRDHGVYTNWTELDGSLPTQPQAMQAAGYRTLTIGKSHLSRPIDHGARHVDELAHLLVAAGWDEVHETGDKFDFGVRNRYLDHLEGIGLLDAYEAHMTARSYQGSDEKGMDATQSIPTWDATPIPLPAHDYIDVWHGRYAADVLRATPRDQPLFCFVGFPGPHDPWDAPAEAVARYADVAMPDPASVARPSTDDTGAYGLLLDGMRGVSCSDSMGPAEIDAMRRAYCAAITLIDAAVGSILGALVETRRLDDTWIVYTSDHGEMAGDHSLLSKCLFYDQTVRVPLIVRPPTNWTGAPNRGRVVHDAVEHVDLPATFRAIAGAPDIPHSAGRSLLGYLCGEDPPPRTVAVSENWSFASFETDAWKIVVDEDRHEPAQLFDRAADPTEDTNLVASSAHTEVVARLMAEVVEPFLATAPKRPHPSPFA